MRRVVTAVLLVSLCLPVSAASRADGPTGFRFLDRLIEIVRTLVPKPHDELRPPMP